MGQTKTKVMDAALEPEKAEKLEKELHSFDKATDPETQEKTKTPKKGKARYRSNRYKTLLKEIDKTKLYSAPEAVELVKNLAKTKFDSGIDAHINLNFSPEKTDQIIRTSITLPHSSSSKKLKILVFSDKNKEELKKAGAEIGTETTLKTIEEGKIGWDKIIADSSWMPKLAKVAKVLGPKGLMPNPKSGTVTDKPEVTVKEFAGGRIDLKTEKAPVIHINIGRKSFKDEQILENLREVVSTVEKNRPESFKKEMIKSVYLTSTMGPSVKIEVSSLKG